MQVDFTSHIVTMKSSTLGACETTGDDVCISQNIALPPGLAPPPGLTKIHADDAEAPPGLVRESHAPTPPPGLTFPVGKATADDHEMAVALSSQVRISGVPDKLLSEAVVEAMLDQVGCNDCLLSFATHRGKPTGSVSVFFTNAYAAQLCVNHFHGRQWGAGKVHAELLCTSRKDTKLSGPTILRMPSQHCKPVIMRTPTDRLQKPSSTKVEAKSLSADAPAFEPSFMFTAGSPAFVPLCGFKSNVAEASSNSKNLAANSETSTELGESGSEDESRSPTKQSRMPALVD